MNVLWLGVSLTASIGIDLDSAVGRDAVRVRLDVRSVVMKLVFSEDFGLHLEDDGTPADDVAARSLWAHTVMDGADGKGTCADVDTDDLNLAIPLGPLFTGVARYVCDPTGGNDLRVRVVGLLRWNDGMIGDRAQFPCGGNPPGSPGWCPPWPARAS